MNEFRCAVVVCAGIAVSILMTSTLLADWIHLKNGSKIQGKVVKKENDRVHVRIPDGKLRIRTSRVRRIEKQGDEAYKLDQARRKRGYGGYERAISYLREVLSKRPGSERARTELKKTYLEAGRKWFREKRISRARKLIERALEQFPDAGKLRTLHDRIEAYERTESFEF